MTAHLKAALDSHWPRAANARWVLVAATLALLAGCGSSLPPAVNPLAATRPVIPGPAPVPEMVGRWFTDAQGRVLVLHGTNMISKYAPYTYASLGFGAKDLQFLAGHGLNAIRLGFIWEALEPQPGVYDDTYLDGLVSMIELAQQYGMVPVFDFHEDDVNEAMGGEGFPQWAYNAAVDDPEPNPLNLGLAWQDFMNDRPAPDGVGVQEHLAAAWGHVAERLRGNRGVIFDGINEPLALSPTEIALGCLQPAGCPVSDITRLAPVYQKLLDAIRAADPQRLVLFEPWETFNNGYKSWLPSFNDTQVGFSFHSYCLTVGLTSLPVLSDLLPQLCDPLLFPLAFDNAAQHEALTGQSMLLTEFGAGDNEDHENAVADLADQYRIGWTHWAYWSQDGGKPQTYALLMNIDAGPVPGNVHLDQLSVLTRPYPRAVAGTPGAWSYDVAANTFSLAYATARVDGSGNFDSTTTTEIVVPSLHYPDGYAVQVTGGQVQSSPNAPVLIIAACPGAGSVQVQVVPEGVSVGASSCG